MPGDNIDGEDQAQGAAAPPRIIWRKGRPFVIDDYEGDGVTRIIPLRIVPEAFFRLGVNLALPDWALDQPDIMADAALQNCVLLDLLIEQRRTSVAALRTIRATLRASITLVEDNARGAAIRFIDDAIKRAGALIPSSTSRPTKYANRQAKGE